MFRKIFKFILPIFILKKINSFLKRNIRIEKNFKTWNEAILSSGSYQNNKIFQKTKNSFLKVIKGKASYERDSVTFYDNKLNKPLILLLEKIRKKQKNHFVKILDFGGSFGSLYFQNKEFLCNNFNYEWDIVEQKKIVDFAKKYIKIENLFFYKSLSNYIKSNKPDIVIFSSVIHYLEFPFLIIKNLIKKKVKYFVILNTPFFKDKSEIKIQINPKYIYKVSYPIRIFNEFLFKKIFRKYKFKIYKLNWDAQQIDGINFKSFFLKKINSKN